MSLIHYSRYRQQGFRRAWELSNMGDFMVRLAIIGLAALVVLAVLGLIDDTVKGAERYGREAQKEELARAKREEMQMSGKLAAAMNGGSLIDTDSKEVYFFEVPKQDGL